MYISYTLPGDAPSIFLRCSICFLIKTENKVSPHVTVIVVGRKSTAACFIIPSILNGSTDEFSSRAREPGLVTSFVFLPF